MPLLDGIDGGINCWCRVGQAPTTTGLSMSSALGILMHSLFEELEKVERAKRDLQSKRAAREEEAAEGPRKKKAKN